MCSLGAVRIRVVLQVLFRSLFLFVDQVAMVFEEGMRLVIRCSLLRTAYSTVKHKHCLSPHALNASTRTAFNYTTEGESTERT